MLAESQRGNLVNRRKVTHPFYGIPDFPPEQSLRDTRRLVLDTVLRPEPETRVTGFKEIRWYQDDLADYCAWLRQVFPGARFVVNTRNQADVLRSKWWAKKDNTAYLAGIEERILRVADGPGRRGVPRPLRRLRRRPDRAARPLRTGWARNLTSPRSATTLGVRHSV